MLLVEAEVLELQTAKILSANGWNVLITCSSSIEAAEIVAAECTSKTAEVIAIKADVANDGDCILTVARGHK